MSLLDYAEVSKIRILLVPIGHLDSETFHKHVEDISCIYKLPLQELSQPIVNKRSKLNFFFFLFFYRLYNYIIQFFFFIFINERDR